MDTTRLTRALLLLTGTLAAPLQAQETLLVAEGDAAGDRFGYALAAAGDVNGDGTADWAVAAPFNDQNRGDSGQVRVFSGVDGSLLLNLGGESPRDLYGMSLCGLGDVNGDGFDDLAVGAYAKDIGGADTGAVYVVSGFDGSNLYRLVGGNPGDHFGFAVASAGDVNGDGTPDLIVGARGVDSKGPNAGAAFVYSGNDGVELFRVPGEAAHDLFGSSVCGLGDLDGDGFGEFAVGARWNDFGGESAGSTTVFRGSDGSILFGLHGLAPGGLFGASIASAGDLDGDGLADLVVGSPGSDLLGSNAGCVQAFSGANGTELFRWLGAAPGDALGISVAGGADVDGDGTPDVIAGAVGADVGGTSAGAVHVFSGATGGLISLMNGSRSGERLGYAVACIADVSGDGKAEALLGAHGDPNKGSLTGKAEVVSLTCLAPTNYCVAGLNGAGKNARMAVRGSVSVAANDFTLEVTDARPGQFGVFYYGTQAMQAPFAGGFQCVGGDIFRLPAQQTAADGSAALPLDLVSQPDPTSDIQPGSTLYFQFWYRDPGGPLGFGANLSDAVQVKFCP